MNWGKGIIAAFILFVLLMLFFLVRTVISGSENVPDKYYEKGNDFQKNIDQKRGGYQFRARVEYDPSIAAFILFFDSIQPDSSVMKLQFSADNSAQYTKKFMEMKKDEMRTILCNNPKGSWNAEVEIYYNGKKFLHHQKVWLP